MISSSGDAKVNLETSTKNVMIDSVKGSRDVECKKSSTLARPCSTGNVVNHFKQSRLCPMPLREALDRLRARLNMLGNELSDPINRLTDYRANGVTVMVMVGVSSPVVR